MIAILPLKKYQNSAKSANCSSYAFQLSTNFVILKKKNTSLLHTNILSLNLFSLCALYFDYINKKEVKNQNFESLFFLTVWKCEITKLKTNLQIKIGH